MSTKFDVQQDESGSIPMKLEDLTMPHVRTLMNIDTCSDADYDEAAKAGLVHFGDCSCTELGIAVGAEAQRVANGIGEWDFHHLLNAATPGGESRTIDVNVAERLAAQGLVEYGKDSDGRVYFRARPCGRLVMTLVIRKRTP